MFLARLETSKALAVSVSFKTGVTGIHWALGLLHECRDPNFAPYYRETNLLTIFKLPDFLKTFLMFICLFGQGLTM